MIYWVLGGLFVFAGTMIMIAAFVKMYLRKKKLFVDERKVETRGDRAKGSPKKRQWKIIMEDTGTWEQYSFVFYDTIAIGRGRSLDAYEKSLSLKSDSRVSKIHCLIKSKNDRLFLVDMESRNGTKLNGKRIDTPVSLKKEDVVTVGGTNLEIVRILREKEQ